MVETNEVDDARLYGLIGDRLKQRRQELGKTQAWLAERVGLLRTSITNIEKGRQKAPLHVVYGLCEALEVDPLEILPPLAEVRRALREEVAINSDRVARVPPKTAEFLREVIDDPERKPQ